MATIELRDIPETAHLWVQKRKVAYRGLTLGAATAGQRRANATALNGYLSDAAGGVLELPAGATIEVDGALSVPGSMRIEGNGATLVDKGALTSHNFIAPSVTGLTIDIGNLTLQGPPEADVIAAGTSGGRAIAYTTNTNLAMHGVTFTGWFGNAVQGAVGSVIDIDRCTFQAWNTHGAGGDGTKAWIVRNSTFGRIGSGGSLDHHLYINPDVWLYLENCEFLNPENNNTNWAVHYYGSDDVGPYRTPLFRNCLFRRKVFTCEKAYTIIENCDFEDTILQIHNDTLINGGAFKNTPMNSRTAATKSVRLVNVAATGGDFNCNIQHPTGTVYQLVNPRLINTVIQNRVHALNKIDVYGGLWESGKLDLANGATAHLDGRLHVSNSVTYQMWGDSTYTTGDVINYD